MMTRGTIALLLALCTLAGLPLLEGFSLHPGRVSSTYHITGNSVQVRLSNLHMSMSSPNLVSTRVQKIKDINKQKEILRDITAAEFALKVEVKQEKNLIDYEKLINKMEDHLSVMQKKFHSVGTKQQELLKRLENMREDLTLASQGLPTKYLLVDKDDEEDEQSALNGMESDMHVSNDTQRNSSNSTDSGLRGRMRIFVRDDGTVDWDGATASAKEVAKFGTELWERLNGKRTDQTNMSFSEVLGRSQTKDLMTVEIQRLGEIVQKAQNETAIASRDRDALKMKLRQARRENKEILRSEIQLLRRLDIRVKELEKRLKLYTLNYDMERICAYIQQELESSTDSHEQRLYIAEVTLVDRQLSSMLMGLQLEEENVDGGEIRQTTPDLETLEDQKFSYLGDNKASMLISLIDDAELNLIFSEVADLKSRLGIDAQLVPAMDWGSLGVIVSEGFAKIKVGLSFFSEGTGMLFSDIQYAWQLLMRAVRGYTLKPREVNAIRRTGKDILVLIPFTIILIIPLSPVGHVLVFSFIQRFFPGFFPSCFSEERFNLRRLFSEIEKKSDDDILGSSNFNTIDWPPSFSEVLTKIGKIDSKNLFRWFSIPPTSK